MDELPPYRDIIFPVAEKHRLKIVDQLVEGKIQVQTPRATSRESHTATVSDFVRGRGNLFF